MSALFPKSYILERIDARLASLARQDVEDVKVAAEWDQEQARLAKTWVLAIPLRLSDALTAAKKQSTKIKETNDPTVIFAAAKEVEDLLRFEREWPSEPNWRSERSRRRETANNSKNALKERARERNALEHTRAYLVDTPVEEFSITALGKLGLMDAIKFNLDQEAEAARVAAKKKGRR